MALGSHLRLATTLSITALIQAFLMAVGHAATCTDHMTELKGGPILSTMTYYARAGQETAVYETLAKEDEVLVAKGVQGYQLYRGPGGSQPTAFWTLLEPNFAAHDEWLKEVNKLFPDDPVFDAKVLRIEHRHFVMHDGWSDSLTCK